MTSNLGTADLRKASVGFAKSSEAVTYEKMKEKVHDALKQHFRPEFLNRIDDVIVFHELTKDEVTEIIDLMVKRVRDQLEAQGLGLELTQAAKYYVVDKGYDSTLGARPLPPGPAAVTSRTRFGEDPVEGVPGRRDDHRRRRAGRRGRRAGGRVPVGRGDRAASGGAGGRR